jgi:hypothetical protein
MQAKAENTKELAMSEGVQHAKSMTALRGTSNPKGGKALFIP